MIAPVALNTQSDGDSDSDWDDDDDFVSKKINIRIKPIAQVTPSKMSASVDELRATVGTWKSLANINLTKPNSRRHHQSNLQLNNPINQQSDLLMPSATSSVVIPESITFMHDNQEVGVDNSKHHQRHINNLQNASSNLTMLDSNNQLPPRATQDLENFNCIYPTNLGFNSEKTFVPSTNGVLQPTPSSTILSPGFQSAFNDFSSRSTTFPVAFAIQECFNNKLLTRASGEKCLSSTNIIGCIKLAVPPKIFDMDFMKDDFKLIITLNTSTPWDKVRLNKKFAQRVDQLNTSIGHLTPNSMMRLSIDMRTVQEFVKVQHQSPSSTVKYYLIPEILRYAIGSPSKKETLNHGSLEGSSPINPIAHWLCDQNITKVCVDLSSVNDDLVGFGLSTIDIRNLKISMKVNGKVLSYQSKPEASWDELESKLIWSFSNLSELVQKSTHNGTTSCLARFDLADGPTTPGDVDVQFSIIGKNLSGTYIILNSLEHFRLAAQKLEVRTGTFTC